MQAIANASTVEQLRQAQAVILPVLFAMSLEQTAQITGLSVSWVSKQRNRFIQGKPVGDADVPARGGRRRENFTPQEEAALLEPFLEQAKEGGVLVIGQIKPHIDAALGRSVSLSSVYALLHRHNWRKLAPDKRHPKSDPIAQEEWKKNVPNRSKNSVKTGRARPSG
jgi:transposase